MHLAALGHLGAGRLLARAVVRVWWPAAVRRRAGVAPCPPGAGRQCGRGGGRCLGVRGVVGAGLDPARFAALALADDAAYGAGVWWGCLRDRSFRALLPSLTGWPARADQPMKDAGRGGALAAPAQAFLRHFSG